MPLNATYRKLCSYAFLLGVAAGSALLVPAPARAAEKLLTLGTGGITGVYYPAGGAICRLVNRARKEHGYRCAVESTGGSINNLEAVREGELNMGMAQSDWMYHALVGDQLFADRGPDNKLRALFALHPEPFTVLTRKESNINSFDQLKGKRLNIGNPGSGMRATMEELMRLKGWSDKSFSEAAERKIADQGPALCDKKIDAMIYAAGSPNGAVQQATMLCDVRIVGVEGADVDEFIRKNPFYSYATIPGGMYRGNPNDIRTFGVSSVLFASEEMDPEAVYQVVKSVFENLDNFKTLHPVFATLDANSMVSGAMSVAPLHPGAVRYYRERGLIK